MNCLSIKLEAVPYQGQRHLDTHVLVDGVEYGTDNVVDWRVLYLTLSHNGGFDIFTCGCGEAGCAGIFDPVIVAHDYCSMYWCMVLPLRRKDQNAQNRRDHLRLEFDRREYIQTIRQAWERACCMLKDDPLLDIGPYGFDRKAMLGLDAWAQSDTSASWRRTYDWRDVPSDAVEQDPE